ncbi:hypothetical protein [Caballeronia sp. Lep1P3]|nr:hypothetical protein [Caballeronia sp. Lep1P3]
MKLARIVAIVFALLAASLAGCQTEGGGGSSSYNRSSGGSMGGGGAY